MRYRIALFLAVFLFCLSPISYASTYNLGYADAAENYIVQRSEFILPDSLQIIEDEAFEGTAVRTVILPDSFLFIGESAFGDIQTLREVYIPESTIFIADSAFLGESFYIIYGIAGSYAEDWAKEHNVPFEEADIWRYILHPNQRLDGNGLKRARVLWILDPFKPDKNEKDTQDDNKSYRVEDRPEFHPIDYRFP